MSLSPIAPSLAHCRFHLPLQTIRSIAGHVSQKMLEHYSHIRLDAKRTALDALSQRSGRGGYGTNSATNEPEASNANSQVVEKNGGADGIRIRQLHGNKGVLRRDPAF